MKAVKLSKDFNMPKFAKLILSATLLGIVSACSAAENTEPNAEGYNEPSAFMQITGKAAYRERIALAPGHVMTVTLSDVSIADRMSPVLAETSKTLTTEQVPISFELTVQPAILKAGHRYAVRVSLKDAKGHIAWTTDTANLIRTDLETQDLGVLRLVSTGAGQ